jgi:hypothetical protein
MPVKTTPTAPSPYARATDAKRRSTEGRSGASAGSGDTRSPTSRVRASRTTVRCIPPGATYTSPGCTGSPSRASRAGSRAASPSISASGAVKRRGMCCATKIGTRVPTGRPARTSCSAITPPVDAPIATALPRSPPADAPPRRGGVDAARSPAGTAVRPPRG